MDEEARDNVSKIYTRYVRYWADHARTHQNDIKILEVEFEHINRAWELAAQVDRNILDKKDADSFLLDITFSMDRFLERHGLYLKNIEWIGRAMEAAQSLKQYHYVGRLGQDLGWCYREIGDLDKALEYLLLALEVRRRFGPKEGEANTLSMIGVVH